MTRITALLLMASVAVLVSAPLSSPQTKADLFSLKTRPERTEYRETSRYDDVAAFLEAVSTGPSAAWASGRTRRASISTAIT